MNTKHIYVMLAVFSVGLAVFVVAVSMSLCIAAGMDGSPKPGYSYWAYLGDMKSYQVVPPTRATSLVTRACRCFPLVLVVTAGIAVAMVEYFFRVLYPRVMNIRRKDQGE